MLTYCSDHFAVYTYILSLCCTPETNTMLYISYTSIKKTKLNLKLIKLLLNRGNWLKTRKQLIGYKEGFRWKQPKCPSTEEWINKMWEIYTMEYYSAIKRDEIVPFAETWMDLETFIQSEVGQKQKNKYHIILLICGI